MKNFKHLTGRQISAYAADSLTEPESIEAGRHLLKCESCRNSLPVPGVEQFWSAIMNDWEADDFSEDEKKKDVYSMFFGFRNFLKLNSNLIWSGTAAVSVFVAFSLAFWLNFAGSQNENEVVRSFDIKSETDSKPLFPSTNDVPGNADRDSFANKNTVRVNPVPKKPKPDLPAAKPSPNYNKRMAAASIRQEEISATRGVSEKCEEEKSFQLETSSEKENLVFKWKKFPGAAKYHLYISDEDEILIDEFETPTKTSFVLRKPLDPQKTYRWKIIITLENGSTVVGDSNKFTAQNFEGKPEKKQKAIVRCAPNNKL